ncbi:hypothetical protein ACLKA6_019247 [Drosophila palustris]
MGNYIHSRVNGGICLDCHKLLALDHGMIMRSPKSSADLFGSRDLSSTVPTGHMASTGELSVVNGIARARADDASVGVGVDVGQFLGHVSRSGFGQSQSACQSNNNSLCAALSVELEKLKETN